MSEIDNICCRLLCIGALIIALAGCTRTTVEPAVDEPVLPVTKTEPAPEPMPEPAPPTEITRAQRAAELACTRVTIAAAGDIMLGTDYPQDRLADDDGRSLLAGVAPVFSEADIAFGNLEGVLMDGGDPVKQCRDPSACYLFRSPARYARHLADAGFTVMSLANNHARDFGEIGRTASMAALDAAGIRHSGRVDDIATWPKGRIKTALIAFSPFVDSHPMLDLDAARASVAALDAMHDVVIVSFHGGAEGVDAARIPFAEEVYFGEKRGNVVAFARAMIEAGADLVIGHGPHVPRAMEIHNDRLIAYSLGNFATWYGISIDGDKGLAPILVATVDGNGRFVSGEIVSAVQVRPFGPQPDRQQRAYERIWELTEQDFGGGGIRFQNGGSFFPVDDTRPGCPPQPVPAGPTP